MDNLKFGAFLAQCRKEKGWTQKELAEQLHVTDKAVSKWERGLGFPDIKLIEPLAELLDVSVLELMRSERMDASPPSITHSQEIATGIIDLVSLQQKLERRNTAIVMVAVVSCLLLFFLFIEIGHFDLVEFLFTYFWIICLVVWLLLMFICYFRYKRNRPWKLLLCLSFVVAVLPILLLFLFLLIAYLGLLLG